MKRTQKRLSPSQYFYTAVSICCFVLHAASVAAASDAEKIALGKLIFNDESLSEPAGLSCNTCHRSDAFYASPDLRITAGANPEHFGNRNSPSIAYIKFNPPLQWDKQEQHWVGGLFLDGRAKTLEDQVQGPFLNPLEMGNATPASLVAKLSATVYVPLLEKIYGKQDWSNSAAVIAVISDAVAHYERGPEFARFTSKYDYYLQGRVKLSEREQLGLKLFEAEDKGNCAACHPSQKGANGELPLFTDYSYDNLGLPRPTEFPFYAMPSKYNPEGKRYVDYGLANNPHINNAQHERGKFKVSSLRNVARTGPYMHNGQFNTLKDVVDFYNTRDVVKFWGKPEVTENLNKDELGDLKLSEEEVYAIVAFLEALTDGYELPK